MPEIKQLYCHQCARLVPAHRPSTNHILHLLLSLVTLGFWVLIWVLSTVKIGGWRCSQCGGTKLTSPGDTNPGSITANQKAVLILLVVVFVLVFVWVI